MIVAFGGPPREKEKLSEDELIVEIFRKNTRGYAAIGFGSTREMVRAFHMLAEVYQ